MLEAKKRKTAVHGKPRAPLEDALPEAHQYRDDGCDLAPACLRCPLPRCKYDDPGWRRREVRDDRDRQILLVMRRESLTVPQLSSRFGVSQRTVFRALQAAREARAGGEPA